MSASMTATQPRDAARQIALVRAVVALLWAAALALVAGDAGSELPAGVAALVAAYPLIDVAASLRGGGALLRVNAAIGLLATAGLAAAAFGSSTDTTLAVFGAWAVVSGAIQLALSRRALPMVASGAISMLAGLWFIASSDAPVTSLAGYAAFGAVFYLVWVWRLES